MKLASIDELQEKLTPYYAVAAETTGKDLTVGRMERLLAHLGNPERKYRVIHIAGTSGKTSTTYFTANLLKTTGKKIGHTVSPHIESITERVQVDGAPLPENQFLAYMGDFLERLQTAPETPSWFECMMAFAMWVFAQEKVDYAVIETGMGGLHDATNVCTAASKLCIITDIGLDHQKFLGNSLLAIATQKAGIIHEGNVVLMYEQADDAVKAVRFKVSQTEGAELYLQQQTRLQAAYGGDFPPHMPEFQKRNWLLAYAAYRYIASRDTLMLADLAALTGTQQLQVPGRMERVRKGSKMVVLDGAHNVAKMTAFVDSFIHEYGDRKVPVLLALKKDKDFESMIPILARIASRLIVTTFTGSQDWPVEYITPEKIMFSPGMAKITEVSSTWDSKKAFSELLETKDDLVVVTGSFYLISDLKKKGLM